MFLFFMAFCYGIGHTIVSALLGAEHPGVNLFLAIPVAMGVGMFFSAIWGTVQGLFGRATNEVNGRYDPDGEKRRSREERRRERRLARSPDPEVVADYLLDGVDWSAMISHYRDTYYVSDDVTDEQLRERIRAEAIKSLHRWFAGDILGTYDAVRHTAGTLSPGSLFSKGDDAPSERLKAIIGERIGYGELLDGIRAYAEVRDRAARQ